MENPQAQMPQGQAGQAPQQGGQDQQMQQIMQYVQQSIQQGAQPVDVAIQLIQQGAQPEMIMQVFVQMGMPEDQAREAIETAMEGGQQQQGTGEETLEGNASNPDEEMAEQGAQPMDQPGNIAQDQMMRFGGSPRRQLKKYADGAAVDPNQELQSVMQQVQDMMQQGADARQVMEQIQAAAQQGQISPEVATSVMEQLSGMQQAENPQGSDAAMMAQSQDPQQMDPNMAAPESQMMKFGGNLRKLMTKAYGGDAIPPSIDSKNYAQDRTAMFVNSVKNNAFKSTLDNEFPSLAGNQMAYGGNLPKAVDGFDVTKYKTKDEAELAAYRHRASLTPEEQSKFDIGSVINTWKAPEPTYEAGKNYQYDPNTKQFKIADVNQQGYNYGYGAINPVAYQNPMGNGLYGNLYAGANPFARMVAGFNMNNAYDPRITGANLPGGMNPEQFLGAIGGVDKLASGMTGTVGDQTWRLGQAEKFKEGSIWKGNRRKGVRYTIDWGNAGAMNPAAPANTVQGPQNSPNPNVATTANNQAPLSTMTPTGGSGMGAMEQFNEDFLTQPANTTSAPSTAVAPNNTAVGTTVNNTPVATRTGGSGMGMMDNGMDEFPSLSPEAATAADQTLINPANTDLINPATEVNPVDQNLTPDQQLMQVAQMFNGQGASQFNPNAPTATGQDLMNVLNNQTPQYSEFPQTFNPNQRQANQQAEAMRLANQKAAEASNALNRVDQQAQIQRQNQSQQSQANTAPVVDYSQIKKGQPASYYQEQLDNILKANNGAIPWNTPNEKEYFRIAELLTGAEKNANWNKKQKAAQQKEADAAAKRKAEADLQEKRRIEAQKRSNSNLNSLAYGGSVDPAALENAVALINRAFGGMIPRAENGMDLGSQDTDVNGIPDYLQANNLPANPFDNTGTIEQSAGKKLNIDWNQVAGAAGDMYMNIAPKVTNFMNKMHAVNPERDAAKYSALNRSANTYDLMSQGIYDQAGNAMPNNIGKGVLNPTDVYYNNQNQIFAYGGRVYAIGGEVDLDDTEVEALRQAGFNVKRS